MDSTDKGASLPGSARSRHKAALGGSGGRFPQQDARCCRSTPGDQGLGFATSTSASVFWVESTASITRWSTEATTGPGASPG